MNDPWRSGEVAKWPRVRILTLFVLLGHLVTWPLGHSAEAAVSEGQSKKLQTGSANQGGTTASSSNFRQQSSIGDTVATVRLSSPRFRIVPGFLGAALSATPIAPVSNLDLRVLYALTEPLGVTIPPRTWQKDNNPIFIWEPPPTGPEVAGYSYAMDAVPDETIDTVGTSLNIASSELARLTDGVHTFSVRAVNSAGNAGRPLSFEIWVDTIPPQIVSSSPPPAAILKTASPTVNAVLSDAHSGISLESLEVLINGESAPLTWDPETGAVTVTRGGWRQGANTVELRAADTAGNQQVPLIWSVTIDTVPPAGTVVINGGSSVTTSVYVTLNLRASDATSGVASMLVSNDVLTGYVQEPFAAVRSLWRLTPVRGEQSVYVKFVDRAGNISEPVTDAIELLLLSPETVIMSGPAGLTPNRAATFTFMCPEGDCVFSYAFDNDAWSAWSPSTTAEKTELAFGNHYFRVKAAKDLNETPGIQPDEEDPSPAERTWIVGVESPLFNVPKGPPVKLWRLE